MAPTPIRCAVLEFHGDAVCFTTIDEGRLSPAQIENAAKAIVKACVIGFDAADLGDCYVVVGWALPGSVQLAQQRTRQHHKPPGFEVGEEPDDEWAGERITEAARKLIASLDPDAG